MGTVDAYFSDIKDYCFRYTVGVVTDGFWSIISPASCSEHVISSGASTSSVELESTPRGPTGWVVASSL